MKNRISFVFINNGTTAVGAMAQTLTNGNQPNLTKNLSKPLKISVGICSFFKQILEYKCKFKSFSVSSETKLVFYLDILENIA